MTCAECELRLAGGEADSAVQEHLLECAGCLSFQQDLLENGLALDALREEELPPLRISRRVWIFPRVFPRVFPWMSAAAAAVILAIVLPGIWLATRPIAPDPVRAKLPDEVTVTASVKTEALRIKMLTPDPDVVIYWLIDSKEGE
jgi:hypothetical protein